MARLRNLSTSLLRPFQSPSPDQQHLRSTSQPLSLQSSDPSAGDAHRGKPLPSPTTREPGLNAPSLQPQRTPTRQGEHPPGSRPTSMMYGMSADAMTREEIEELRPVFSFLSSHANKLYQEGYFLKLNDLDTNGKPFSDRSWTECFAQLVGTVLSLWDAAALDAAGHDGEVAPTFINLADASIKMIETLPTRNPDVQPLQNVLSISTAGKNRYLLHFNSHHSLTQWTAGIRLAMFEHASLQELYTGSLIAGKGKHLNNIKSIMERTKFVSEDWARVRFGAGTPWRRCWCVIEPPNEKEFAKAQKTVKKSRNPYERPRHPKGCIKFYDTKKTKKTLPIATINEAYAAYAIYPQSKPLIDQSTLVKVEGKITIHSNPESRTEGFVFVMPEVHPAVSGFEMMLRWLFPVFDTFVLYGRPERLIADRGATNGLMFAMPQEKRYGYLDIIDVASLIHTNGSDKWSEHEWRKRMKEATRSRMEITGVPRTSDNLGSRRGPSDSYASRNGVRYDDGASIRSTPSTRHQHNQSSDAVFAASHKPNTSGQQPFSANHYHSRSASESLAFSSPSKSKRQDQGYGPSRLSMDTSGNDLADVGASPRKPDQYRQDRQGELDTMESKNSSDSDLIPVRTNAEDVHRDGGREPPPAPVIAPPTFTHQPGEKPLTRPTDRPELRREKSRMSNATLSQMVEANRNNPNGSAAAAVAAWRAKEGALSESPRGVNDIPDDRGPAANQDLHKGMVADSPANLAPMPTVKERSPSAHSVSRKPLPRSPSAHSITRKPLPGQDPPPVPILNESAIGLATEVSTLAVPPMQRQASGSQYSNDISDPEDEPGENPFTDIHRVERPRTGVMRTAGDPVYDDPPKSDIPSVDFGVTKSLNPNVSRPSTTGSSSVRGGSPNHGGVTTDRRDARSQSRSPVPWRPGSGRQSPGPSLTPEEFVQQHAAATRIPSSFVPYRPQTAGEPLSHSKQVQKPAAQPPAHQAAQLAFNHSQQQQKLAQRTPAYGPEFSSQHYGPQQQNNHGQPPNYQQQPAVYNYAQQSQNNEQGTFDSRSSGQFVHPQTQSRWWGANPQQQQQEQNQKWQQNNAGYYGPQQGRR